MRFAPRFAKQAVLSLPTKFWKISKPLISRPITMRMHPGERISVLSWYSRSLIISLSKAKIQIRTGNAYKKMSKISNMHNFWIISIFGHLFLFHTPSIWIHSTSKISEKTLNFIRVSSKNFGDQKSAKKINSEKSFDYYYFL